MAQPFQYRITFWCPWCPREHVDVSESGDLTHAVYNLMMAGCEGISLIREDVAQLGAIDRYDETLERHGMPYDTAYAESVRALLSKK